MSLCAIWGQDEISLPDCERCGRHGEMTWGFHMMIDLELKTALEGLEAYIRPSSPSGTGQ
jgi:hypothetical protein